MSHQGQIITLAIDKLKEEFEISEELAKAIRWKMFYVYKKGRKRAIRYDIEKKSNL